MSLTLWGAFVAERNQFSLSLQCTLTEVYIALPIDSLAVNTTGVTTNGYGTDLSNQKIYFSFETNPVNMAWFLIGR